MKTILQDLRKGEATLGQAAAIFGLILALSAAVVALVVKYGV